MVNSITDEIDVLLLKLNVNNCADISQNLKIKIKGETNKRNVLPLLQKNIDGTEGEDFPICQQNMKGILKTV